MRVTNEQVKVVCMKPSVLIDDTNLNFVWSEEIALDLLEARELIKEMRQMLLAISQYPIAFVCEDVRTLARNEWEKSKEYAE